MGTNGALHVEDTISSFHFSLISLLFYFYQFPFCGLEGPQTTPKPKCYAMLEGRWSGSVGQSPLSETMRAPALETAIGAEGSNSKHSALERHLESELSSGSFYIDVGSAKETKTFDNGVRPNSYNVCIST